MLVAADFCSLVANSGPKSGHRLHPGPVQQANSTRLRAFTPRQLFRSVPVNVFSRKVLRLSVLLRWRHVAVSFRPTKRKSQHAGHLTVFFPSGVARELPIAYSGWVHRAGMAGSHIKVCSRMGTGRQLGTGQGRTDARAANACSCSISTPVPPDQELRGCRGAGSSAPVIARTRFPGHGRPSAGSAIRDRTRRAVSARDPVHSSPPEDSA